MQKVECLICHEMYKYISWAHLKKHGLTTKEYKERFPGAILKSPKFLELKDEFTKLWIKGDTYEKISKTLNISAPTVYFWSKKLKLPRRSEAGWASVWRMRGKSFDQQIKTFLSILKNEGTLTRKECLDKGYSPGFINRVIQKRFVKRAQLTLGGGGTKVYGSSFLFNGMSRSTLLYLSDWDLAKRIIHILPEKADKHVRRSLTYRLKEFLPRDIIYWIYDEKGYGRKTGG